MRLEVKKHLYDIRGAASLLAEFTKGKDFATYESDAMLRSAAGVAFAAFGAAALLAVWDAAGRFYPLHGFPQNMGLAFGALA